MNMDIGIPKEILRVEKFHKIVNLNIPIIVFVSTKNN